MEGYVFNVDFRLGVADFADHDDVWILPQNASEPACKGHTLLEIDLSLRNALRLILNWIVEHIEMTPAQRGLSPIFRKRNFQSAI